MWIKIGLSSDTGRSKRPDKGSSLLDQLDDYTVLDIETTGRDPNCDRIIQVSCLTIRNCQIADQYDTYINPEIEINSFISSFTGITNEMVANAPTINAAAPDILEFIGDDVVVGHNVNFDINFLYDAFLAGRGVTLPNDYIDTMRMARRLFPEWPDHRLSTLVANFGLPAETFHNSLADVTHTFRCYEYMKDLIRNDQADKHRFSIVQGRKKYHNVQAKDIKPACCEFDPDDPFCGKTFVFTGALDRMDRKDAMQLVVDHGGQCFDYVNRKLNYLVVGDYSKSWGVKNGKTEKLKKAEDLILAGQDLQIISEDVFFGMLEEYEKIKPGNN